MKIPDPDLKQLLEEKVRQYNTKEFIQGDPLSIPHLFSSREDIEISSLLTATMSWGKRSGIVKSAAQLMARMDMQPYRFVIGASDKELEGIRRFYHRTFKGSDCLFFLHSLRIIYRHHGGLEKVFMKGYLHDETVKSAIVFFRDIFLNPDHPVRVEKHVPDPARNSAAKRLNMFLRWMVRKDRAGVDFGIWNLIPPSSLICPLDVHSGRVARYLGLLKRRANDWQAAEELTENLRAYDSIDPVKYDFALFGLGVFERF